MMKLKQPTPTSLRTATSQRNQSHFLPPIFYRLVLTALFCFCTQPIEAAPAERPNVISSPKLRVEVSEKDGALTIPDGRIVKARDYVKFQRGEQSRSYETPPCRNVFAH